MQIGVPKETVEHERRIALVPDVVRKLLAPTGEETAARNEVVVERGAGDGALIPDAHFEEAGAKLAAGPEEVYASQMVVKVAPPSPEEIARLTAGSVLVGFLAPLSNGEGIRAIAESGAT